MTDSKEFLNNIHHNIDQYCDAEFKWNFDEANPMVRLHEPSFGAEEINAAIDQMLTTNVTMGKQVRRFEDQYADYFGLKNAVMNNSGSSANLLAIAALANSVTENGLKPGDEVIVSALSWATTIWPIIQYQLVPVFVDCDPHTYNMDMEKLEAAITPKTRAIMPVHVYGNPCDMDGIMSLVKKHNLILIEDCCEAMGASYNDTLLGNFGRIATYSFYFSHHITTFEGGITVTNDFALSETMRILRAHGWSREADEKQKYIDMHPDINPRFIFVNLGYNLRPTEVQAVMGQKQLPKLEGFTQNRRAAYDGLCAGLAKYGDLLEFQKEQENGRASWFGFGITVKENAPFTSDELASFFNSKNIETRPIIAGNIAKHPVMKSHEHRIAGSLDAVNRMMDRGVAIACHHHLDQKAVDYVCACVDEFMAAKGIKAAA